MSEFALLLRQRKKELRLNVREIAKKANVAHGTVINVLKGRDGILFRKIKAVAEALGVEAIISIKRQPMRMYDKMKGVLSNIKEGYSNSGGDFDVLQMIESARQKHDLDPSEVEYLKLNMADDILSQKRARGEI